VHMVLTSRGMVRRTMSSNRGQIEFYRANAAQCIAVAQRTSDTSSKLALLEMARAWLLLAEQGEKNGETTLVYETPPPFLRDQADPVWKSHPGPRPSGAGGLGSTGAWRSRRAEA
jgi:hypothetical protein